MTVRRFIKEDLRSFRPNQFSDLRDVEYVFDDPAFDIFTLLDGNKIEAIIVARRYWGNNYMAFFLVSADFRPRNAIKLRNFVHSTHERFGVKRIQTDSQANDVLDSWHVFLGFKLEGRREKMMHGRDYHSWALVMGD